MGRSGERRTALSLFLVAALAGGCSSNDSGPGAAPTTPAPTTSSSPTTATSPTPTVLPQARKLPGRLLFSDFAEVAQQFTGQYVVFTDGSGSREVPLPSSEGGGSWSPDGKSIAVPMVRADDRVTTAIIAPDGTVLRTFPPLRDGLNLVCTIWTPDSSRLACEGWDDHHPARRGIYPVRASDGADVLRLTTAPQGLFDFPGSWTPDGSHLVFKRSGEESPGPLLLVSADGGAPQGLVGEGVEDEGRISPDGRLLLTSRRGALLVYKMTGELVREISENHAFLFGPVWSPDGKYIAYSRFDNGPFSDLWVARPDGSHRARVADFEGNAINVDWGP